jgi:hypothetical protein
LLFVYKIEHTWSGVNCTLPLRLES